jgi:hypothetical protein
LLAAQPPEIVERLRSDELVVLVSAETEKQPKGGGPSIVVGFVIFEPGPPETYRMLSQTTRQIEYRSELTDVANVEWNERGPVDVHHIQILFRRYSYHLQYILTPETQTLGWQLDASYANDLDRVDGRWELYEMDDGRTLARFTTGVEVAAGVPRFLQDYFTRKNLPSTLGNCRRWVNSKGRFRP